MLTEATKFRDLNNWHQVLKHPKLKIKSIDSPKDKSHFHVNLMQTHTFSL